jgi:hypothetical protein
MMFEKVTVMFIAKEALMMSGSKTVHGMHYGKRGLQAVNSDRR